MRGVIGTGGHIDHGKTALVRALTGVDTDRLPEERRRGISIDLGFTELTIGEGRYGVVDVPGHEDFIRNMLAGATGIDLFLLVVAADEGVMPQTREHVRIAELLGIERAVVALTKADLVEEEWLALVRGEVGEFLADTPFADAPRVATSMVTGRGIEELRELLATVDVDARGDAGDLFRLPVDRVFTVRGTGTVATGTVWTGRLRRDEAVRLMPQGLEARVRGLQVHGEDVETVEAGQRAAVALAGIDRDRLDRGTTLVTAEAWTPTSRLTVRLRVLAAPGWSIEPWQRVRVHLGTAEVMARVVLLDREERLEPGSSGWAQLRLEETLVARAGDRLVIRSYSPVTTIGGGVVAEPAPAKRTRLGEGDVELMATLASGPGEAAIGALLRAAGSEGVPAEAVPVLAGASPADAAERSGDAVRAGGRLFARAASDAVERRLIDRVETFHRDRPLRMGMDPEQLRRAAAPADPALVDHALDTLLAEGTLRAHDGLVAAAAWTPELDEHEERLKERVAETLADAGVAPPRVEDLADALGDPEGLTDLLALLEAEGRVVRLEHDLFIDASTLEDLVAAVRTELGGRDALGPADFRRVAPVSRRQLMPLLAYLDRIEVTVRGQEGRTVPGV